MAQTTYAEQQRLDGGTMSETDTTDIAVDERVYRSRVTLADGRYLIFYTFDEDLSPAYENPDLVAASPE